MKSTGPSAAGESTAATPIVMATPYVPIQSGARGTWSTGPLSCFGDWCSCLAVFCCYPITAAQLCAKFSTSRSKLLLFLCTAIVLFAGQYVLPCFTSPSGHLKVDWEGAQAYIANHTEDDDDDVITMAVFYKYTTVENVKPTVAQQIIACFCAVTSVLIFLIVCIVRGRVRARDQIPEESCQGCEDCCCSFWFGPCTQCQILRHEGLTWGKYSLFSPTGHV